MADAVRSKRESRRQVVEGATLGVGVVLAAALLLLVNYLGGKYFVRADWTTSELYSLSDKTRNVLSGLTQDVEVTIFMQPQEGVYELVRETLARYEAASPRIKVRSVDPDKNVLEAQRLVDRGVTSRDVVVFESGNDRRIIEQPDLADYDYSGAQFREEPRMTAFKGEQRFTGAIVELAESRKPKILFTGGHGEAGLAAAANGRALSRAEQMLGRDNFELEEWASLGKPAVPAGTDLVVVAGPTLPFVPPELDVLSAYLDQGGRLLVMLDPSLPASGAGTKDLVSWLGRYGAVVGDDIVIDLASPLPFFGAETFFAKSYPAEHASTRALRQAGAAVVFSLARSVGRGNPPTGWEAFTLVETSAEGWGERDLSRLDQAVRKDPSDLAGPVPLAIALAPAAKPPAPGSPEEPSEDAEGDSDIPSPAPAGTDPELPGARLVVFGDVDWATDSQLESANNAVLLADTMNWLAARPQLLGIAAKTPEQARLNLTTGGLRAIFAGVVGLMPGLAIAAGVLVFLKRRR